nr:MAG TPA: hypothetical protein [Caudoviricetes sp.]
MLCQWQTEGSLPSSRFDSGTSAFITKNRNGSSVFCPIQKIIILRTRCARHGT